MKTILILFLSFFTSLGFAQKVKVKKDVILIEKEETPLRVNVDNTNYEFTDSSTGEVFVTANYQYDKINDDLKFEWLVLSSKYGEFENEVDFKYLSFTLNMKKAVAEFLMKELNFFDEKGVLNKEALQTYFGQQRERENKKNHEEISSQANAAQREYSETANLGIDVDPDMNRIFRGSIPYTSSSTHDRVRNAEVVENMIGSYRFADANTIIIRDLDLVKIAEVTQDLHGSANVQSQLLTTPINFKSRKRFSPTDKYSTKDFIIEVVRHLHAHGIQLGHEANEMVADANAQVREEAKLGYEEAKSNSSNFYDVPGYAIDDKGERYEGKILMIFENIEDPTDPMSGGNIVSLDGDKSGKKVRVEYLNEKDKKKFKTLSAKEGVSFCVFDENGLETCFQSVNIKSNGLLASGEITGEKFLKEVFEEGSVKVYQELPTQNYLIKTSKQDKAFNFLFGDLIKEEKKAAKLNEYLGCEYNNGIYDEDSFNDLENIKKLVNFYNTSCK